MDFATFKAGPGGALCRRLGLDMSSITSWYMMHAMALAFNNSGEEGEAPFVDAAKELDGVASSGERVLLHAILFACDFAWLADELAGGRAWRRMDNVSGEHKAAVVACIMRESR